MDIAVLMPPVQGFSCKIYFPVNACNGLFTGYILYVVQKHGYIEQWSEMSECG